MNVTDQLAYFSPIVTPHFMRNRSPSKSGQHQLFLSLSPHHLNILHLQRGWMGWRRAHDSQCVLLEGDDFLGQIQHHISQCVVRWKLPHGVRAHWILAGDIMGIIPPTSSDISAAAALPFTANDTRIQPDEFAKAEQPSIMWMHKDWVAEVERISGHSQLTLVEIYARAQLFQRYASRFSGQIKVLIEHESGQHFLHIYAENGMMLRTKILGDKEPQSLHSLLQAELSSLNVEPAVESNRKPRLLAPQGMIADATQWPAFESSPTKEFNEFNLLEQHWRSDLGGIVIRSTYDGVVKKIKLLSAGMAVIGLAGLSVMAWHDGKLQQQIEEGRAQVRKNLPGVDAAKALKSKTTRMADAVGAAKVFRENTNAMAAFTQILANFPPPPATLLYVRTDEKSLAFAGSGDEGSVNWFKEKPFLGYEPLVELPVPDFLQSSNPSIHFQSQKSNLSNMAVPKALAASTAEVGTKAP